MSVTGFEVGGVGGHTVCTYTVKELLTLEVAVVTVRVKKYVLHVDKNPAGMYSDWLVYPRVVRLTFPPTTDQVKLAMMSPITETLAASLT